MDDKIGVIVRQTIYNEEEAKQHLERLNGDVMAVIREYLTGSSTRDEKMFTGRHDTTNQQVYKSIDDFLKEQKSKIGK